MRTLLDRGPTSLLQRVRWLFLLFALLVLAILVVDLDRPQVPWWPHKAALVGAVFAAAGSVVHRYRRSDAGIVADAVPIAAILTLGVVTGSSDYVFGPTFVLLYHRVLYGSRAEALVMGALYNAAFLAVLAAAQGFASLLDRGVPLLLLVFLTGALVMQALAEAARRHEEGTRRERILTNLSSDLLQATSEEDVHRGTVRALAEVVGGGATAAFWVPTADGRFEPTAVVGPGRVTATSLVDTPVEHLRNIVAGVPFMLDEARTRAMVELLGQPTAFRELLVVPLVSAGRLDGIVIVAPGTTPLEGDLLDIARRFTNEVALGLTRVTLTTRLERTAANLRRADEAKNRFLSTVSHELRTPLTVARGFTETLLARDGSLTEADRVRFLGVIHRQTLRQQRLVDDLLTTSRILAGRLRIAPQPTDIRAAVIDVAEDLGLMAQLDLRLATATDAEVDPLHLSQILTNLLSNARRYGRPPYVVGADRSADQLTLHVRDHGPGIADDARTTLFEPFEQGAGAISSHGGVGLGLAIARRLALANAGALRVCEQHGPGACFALRLPAVSPAPDGRPPSHGAPPTGTEAVRTG